jgi:threonine dehydrogenase-like Zn-dependent dehydrogenase
MSPITANRREWMGAIAVVDTDRAGWLEQVKAEGSLDHRKLIMYRFPFGEVREAFRVAGSRGHRAIKVMVTL